MKVNCVFAFGVEQKKGFKCQVHAHPCVEIVYHEKCAGWNLTPKDKKAYKAGDFHVFLPDTEHWVENTRAGTSHCFGIEGAGAESLKEVVAATDENLRKIFETLIALYRSNDPHRQELLDLWSGILVVEVRRFQGTQSKATHTQIASKAKAILDESYSEPISIQDLASGLFVSPVYLRRLFKESFGESPLGYLIQKRIEHSCDMLHLTELSIQEIAERCGFENTYYFSRIFKQKQGTSPSKYRQLKKREADERLASS